MLGNALNGRLADLLLTDDAVRAGRYPGTTPGRHPVHTVCIAAERYHHGTVEEWGLAAAEALQEFGPLPGFEEPHWGELEPLVHDKLRTEPIEDLRIDVTGGLWPGGDVEHAERVRAVARSLAASHADRSTPLSVGIRIPALMATTRRRAVATLDLLLSELLEAAKAHAGRLGEVSIPDGFRLALPEVHSVVQIAAMVELCEAMEVEYGLAAGLLRFDIEVAAPQLIVGADGTAVIAQMIHAASGRCTGLQYRDGDFSAALGIVAPTSGAQHPSAEHAKRVLQLATAETGIPVCDSPVGLSDTVAWSAWSASPDAVRSSWQHHAAAVSRALRQGITRGTDVHPIQLVSRYAATFSFYRTGLAPVIERLNRCLASGPDLEGPWMFDGAATLRAMAAFIGRGLDCGAFGEDVLAQVTGPASRPLDRAQLDLLASGS